MYSSTRCIGKLFLKKSNGAARANAGFVGRVALFTARGIKTNDESQREAIIDLCAGVPCSGDPSLSFNHVGGRG
jgi:hypothetical protein